MPLAAAAAAARAARRLPSLRMGGEVESKVCPLPLQQQQHARLVTCQSCGVNDAAADSKPYWSSIIKTQHAHDPGRERIAFGRVAACNAQLITHRMQLAAEPAEEPGCFVFGDQPVGAQPGV